MFLSDVWFLHMMLDKYNIFVVVFPTFIFLHQKYINNGANEVKKIKILLNLIYGLELLANKNSIYKFLHNSSNQKKKKKFKPET